MRSRRGQYEVKTPQDASEKSNMFDPQDSLTTRSRRLETVLRSPHTAKTRSRRAKDACVFGALLASHRGVFYKSLSRIMAHYCHVIYACYQNMPQNLFVWC